MKKLRTFYDVLSIVFLLLQFVGLPIIAIAILNRAVQNTFSGNSNGAPTHWLLFVYGIATIYALLILGFCVYLLAKGKVKKGADIAGVIVTMFIAIFFTILLPSIAILVLALIYFFGLRKHLKAQTA